MIDGYLAFAKGEGQEKSVRVQLDEIMAQMIRQSEKLQSGKLAWQLPGNRCSNDGSAGTSHAASL